VAALSRSSERLTSQLTQLKENLALTDGSAHLWCPAVAKLQAASVPMASAAVPWHRQNDGSRYSEMPPIGRGIISRYHMLCTEQQCNNRRRCVTYRKTSVATTTCIPPSPTGLSNCRRTATGGSWSALASLASPSSL